MKKFLSLIKFSVYGLAGILSIYVVLLIFPQVLFAHQVSYKNFDVYSRQPLDANIYKVLDSAEVRLEKSPFYDKNLTHKIFISDTFPLYAFLNPKGRGSFGNTTTGIGIMINRADVSRDWVFRNAEQDNKRPLSDVIAHETTHLLIQNKLGLRKAFALPRWKVEGYCEYVAGNTTIGFEEGTRRWKENSDNDSTYLYFKYHQMVRYLLDDEKISVNEIFTKDFDEKGVSAKVFAKINQN